LRSFYAGSLHSSALNCCNTDVLLLPLALPDAPAAVAAGGVAGRPLVPAAAGAGGDVRLLLLTGCCAGSMLFAALSHTSAVKAPQNNCCQYASVAVVVGTALTCKISSTCNMELSDWACERGHSCPGLDFVLANMFGHLHRHW
jgi:hypothetical protein